MRALGVMVLLAMLGGVASARPLTIPPLRPAASSTIRGWIGLEALQERAHQAGLKAIFDAWQTYKTSTTLETYPAYYGRSWDSANRPKEGPSPAAPKTDETKKAVVADSARLERITKVMAKTQAGRAALEVMKQYDVQVRFIERSSAGYFSSRTNLIAMGKLRPAADNVNTLLHELNHAFTFHTKNAASVRSPRQTYVDAKIEDESRSDGLVAVAAREFARINRRAGSKVVGVTLKKTTPLYLEAYKKVIAEGRAARVASRD